MSFPLPNDNLVYVEQLVGPRRWHSGMPVGSASDGDYIVSFFDFIRPTDLSSSDWTTVKDTGASAAVGTDADAGTVVLTSTATTDADGASVQGIQKCIQLISGKKLWWECRAKISDATNSKHFFGLSVAWTTNPENVLVAANFIGFAKDTASTAAYLSVNTGSVNQTIVPSPAVPWVADTYKVLSFFYDGSAAGTVKAYIDRNYVGSITAGLPTTTAMANALFNLSGNNTGTKTATIDYVMVVRER